MDILNAQLQSIGFKYIPQQGIEAWSKQYKGFILFAALSDKGNLFCAIRFGKVEVSIPFGVGFEWVKQFDKENRA